MAYTPINLPVYIAAYAGALAGMGVSDRVPSDTNAADYDALCAIAGQYAQTFDTLYNPGSTDTLYTEAIEEMSEAVWQNRAPQSVTAGAMTSMCNALIAMLSSAGSYFAGQGIPTNVAGGSVTPMNSIFFVDTTTTSTTRDGSASNPFNSIQECIDNITPPPGTPITVFANGIDVTPIVVPANYYLNVVGLIVINGITIGEASTFTGQLVFNAASVTLAGLNSVALFINGAAGDIVITGQSATFRAVGTVAAGSITAAPGISSYIVFEANPAAIQGSLTGYAANAISGPISAPDCGLVASGVRILGAIEAYQISLVNSVFAGGLTANERLFCTNCRFDATPQTITTLDNVYLKDCDVGIVTFDNAVGKGFYVDNVTNYWITNAPATITNAGEKIIMT